MIKIECLSCTEILTSEFIHDFQQCSCENKTFADSAMVEAKDGTLVEMGRIGGVDMKLIRKII